MTDSSTSQSPSVFKSGRFSTDLIFSAMFSLLQAGRRACRGQGLPSTSHDVSFVPVHNCLFKAFASQGFPGREEPEKPLFSQLLAMPPLPVGKTDWQVAHKRHVPGGDLHRSPQDVPESLVWAVSSGSELQGGTSLLRPPCCPLSSMESRVFSRSSGCSVWPFPCSLCFTFLPVLLLTGKVGSCTHCLSVHPLKE